MAKKKLPRWANPKLREAASALRVAEYDLAQALRDSPAECGPLKAQIDVLLGKWMSRLLQADTVSADEEPE